MIVGARTGVGLVHLRGNFDLIAARMAARRGHFMPTSLLQSQFQTLEDPGPDERPLVESVALTPRRVSAVIARYSG